MYEYVRVFNHKGLTECTLENLGRVNIICGRNNSGKTTILEALDSSEHRAYGKKFGERNVDEIYEQTRGIGGWDRRSPGLESRYRAVLTRAIAVRIWYSDQAEEFIAEVDKLRKDTDLRSFGSFNTGILVKAYESQFPESTRTILLPPKRYLEPDRRIETSQAVSPDGAGILNRLFHEKNQPTRSSAGELHEHVVEAFSRISSGYKFDIFSEPGDRIRLHFSFEDGQWAPADAWGLGLQDLLVILHFCLSPDYDIVLIEEPESHMHPDMQRRLLHFLREQTLKRFFLSTHSNVFLDNAYVDRVFFVTFTGTAGE
jgi:energy-coupling factor transporter ATP-binding protein EcfA2